MFTKLPYDLWRSFLFYNITFWKILEWKLFDFWMQSVILHHMLKTFFSLFTFFLLFLFFAMGGGASMRVFCYFCIMKKKGMLNKIKKKSKTCFISSVVVKKKKSRGGNNTFVKYQRYTHNEVLKKDVNGRQQSRFKWKCRSSQSCRTFRFQINRCTL